MGTDFSDKNGNFWAGSGPNPSFDGVHMFGDDGSFNIGLLAINPTIPKLSWLRVSVRSQAD